MAGTNPGTGTAYLSTILAAVGPYTLPVPGLVPGQRRWVEDSMSLRGAGLTALSARVPHSVTTLSTLPHSEACTPSAHH